MKIKELYFFKSTKYSLFLITLIKKEIHFREL